MKSVQGVQKSPGLFGILFQKRGKVAVHPAYLVQSFIKAVLKILNPQSRSHELLIVVAGNLHLRAQSPLEPAYGFPVRQISHNKEPLTVQLPDLKLLPEI